MAQAVAAERIQNPHGRSSFRTLRSSNFVMKFTDFTGKLKHKKQRDTEKNGAAPYRNARSMDVPHTQKPFMSQPMLALHMPDPMGVDQDSSSPGNSSSQDGMSHAMPPPRMPLSRQSSREDSDAEMPAGVNMDGPPPEEMLDMMDMSPETFMNMPMRIRRKLMKRFVQYQQKKSPTNWARVNFLGRKNASPAPPSLRHTASSNTMAMPRPSHDVISNPMPLPRARPSVDATLAIPSTASRNTSATVSPTTPNSAMSNGSTGWKSRVKFLGRKSTKSFSSQSSAAASETTAVEGLPPPSASGAIARQLAEGSSNTAARTNGSDNTGSPSLSTRRPHRLASMPPLDMPFVATADNRARLSPSIMSRPMPLLNLPTLSTPSPLRSATLPGGGIGTPTGESTRTPMPAAVARLRSMPLLPMSGATPTEDHEHDHSDDDYMDEEEMEDDMSPDADEMDANRAVTMTPGGSDEEGGDESSQAHDNATTPKVFSPPPRIEFSNWESPGLHIDFSRSSSQRSSVTSTRTTERPPGHVDDAAAAIGPSPLSKRPTTLNLDLPAAIPEHTFNGQEGLATPRATEAPTPIIRINEGPSVLRPSTPETQIRLTMEIPPFGSPRLPRGAASPITPMANVGKRNSLRLSQGIMQQMPSARPGMYHQMSRSMVDLASASLANDTIEDAASKRLSRLSMIAKGKVPDGGLSTVGEVPGGHEMEGSTSEGTLLGPPKTVVRRRSLPMFNSSGPPPPYPAFLSGSAQGFKPAPRDEEGMERLPTYSNDIYLIAVMPRKLEFSAPGVQAKDRKWRRALCVLEGTAFSVYSISSGQAGVGVISSWWEKKVGVGDLNLVGGTFGGPSTGAAGGLVIDETPRNARLRPTKWADGEEVAASGVMPGEEPVSTTVQVGSSNSNSRSRRLFGAGLLHPSRANGSSPNSRPPSPSGRSSLQLSRSSSRRSSHSTGTGAATTAVGSGGSTSNLSTNATSTNGHSHSMSMPIISVTTSRSPTRSHFRHARSGSASIHSQDKNAIPEPHPDNLVKEYSLQNAESGLASDYLKRKNVIRVRMEGEQFLLQAVDIAAVVEWIEGLQAATNIALDLDDRPMPRGPIFPRRRRRRRIRVDGVTPGSA